MRCLYPIASKICYTSWHLMLSWIIPKFLSRALEFQQNTSLPCTLFKSLTPSPLHLPCTCCLHTFAWNVVSLIIHPPIHYFSFKIQLKPHPFQEVSLPSPFLPPQHVFLEPLLSGQFTSLGNSLFPCLIPQSVGTNTMPDMLKTFHQTANLTEDFSILKIFVYMNLCIFFPKRKQ